MPFQITMDEVASYKAPSTLQSDKKVTLIYGLNGAGKSTLSNYLYEPDAKKFASCSNDGFDDAHLYVYNSRFVRENFYEIDNLSGVFTLSKINKEIEKEIRLKTEKFGLLEIEEGSLSSVIELKEKGLADRKAAAEIATWEIKTKYSGGDRVLEYCLRGLMQAKGRLFDYIVGLPLPAEAPKKTIEMLKQEVEAIQGEQARSFDLLPSFLNRMSDIEEDKVFAQPIVGNQDSPIAGLIVKLSHMDWVAQGLNYAEVLRLEGDETCPFCQEQTLSESVVEIIKNYFDETFDISLNNLKTLLSSYQRSIQSQPVLGGYEDNPFFVAKKEEIQGLYDGLSAIWNSNIEAIERKIKAPSVGISLRSSSEVIDALNNILKAVNEEIVAHNKKIENRKTALQQIFEEFWRICRWHYNAPIESFKQSLADRGNERLVEQSKLVTVKAEKVKLAAELANLQKKTVNVEEAIGVINSRLDDLGIDSFRIIKAEGQRYRLSRNGTEGEDFLTLSEGEKTVISFLYFVELCKGKRTPSQIGEKKIVVIDDPISSLSHIYIFNIGELIKAEFSNSEKFEHVIILTHSLYFFYELTEIDQARRHERQRLMRIVKTSAGSKIVDMKYEEVQNDYQAYWNVVMDDGHHPALIANCMRNIIEYFFNFVKKMPLANVFQQEKLREPQHKAFYRFMNRESHSLAQNIFDMKEFDYASFKESFKLVFEESGFGEHYKAMAKGR